MTLLPAWGEPYFGEVDLLDACPRRLCSERYVWVQASRTSPLIVTQIVVLMAVRTPEVIGGVRPFLTANGSTHQMPAHFQVRDSCSAGV